jgi:hypothetical protein
LDIYSIISSDSGGGAMPLHYFLSQIGEKMFVGLGDGNRLVLGKLMDNPLPTPHLEVEWSQLMIPEHTPDHYHQPMRGTSNFFIHSNKNYVNVLYSAPTDYYAKLENRY